MPEAAATTTATTDAAATTTAAATTAAPAAWYEGKADLETVGYLQNKGWDKDATHAALEGVKAYRAAERLIGAPPDQIIRLPKDAKDEAGWNAVWQRLGAPKDAKDYDFSAIKLADGKDIDPALADHMRQSVAALKMPKDMAAEVAKSVVKFIEGQEASKTAEFNAKLETERALLAKSWGPNAEMNKVLAQQGAKRLGIAPEAIAALEKTAGYAAVMEAMRKVGAGTSEDTFVDGKVLNPTTAVSAQARLNELMADKAWGKRLLAGDAAANREYQALTEQIVGVSAAAA